MADAAEVVLAQVAYLLVREQLPFDTVAKLFECASVRAAADRAQVDAPYLHVKDACRMLARQAVKNVRALEEKEMK